MCENEYEFFMYLSAPCINVDGSNKNIKLLFCFSDYINKDYSFENSSIKDILYQIFQIGLDKNHLGWTVKSDEFIIPIYKEVPVVYVKVKNIPYVVAPSLVA